MYFIKYVIKYINTLNTKPPKIKKCFTHICVVFVY